jgi:hypothetical protein
VAIAKRLTMEIYRMLRGSAIRRREWLKDISALCGKDYRVLRRARPGRV